MLERIPLRLFYEWLEYYKRYSFGDELANARQAITAFVIAKGNGSRTCKVEDFIPTARKSPKSKQSYDAMRGMMSMLAPIPEKDKK